LKRPWNPPASDGRSSIRGRPEKTGRIWTTLKKIEKEIELQEKQAAAKLRERPISGAPGNPAKYGRYRQN